MPDPHELFDEIAAEYAGRRGAASPGRSMRRKIQITCGDCYLDSAQPE